MSDPIYIKLSEDERFKVSEAGGLVHLTVESLWPDDKWRSSQDEGTGFPVVAADAVADAIRLAAGRASE